MAAVTRRVDDATAVAAYAYDGKNRRTVKAVSHCGAEQAANDGGDTVVQYYYSDRWQIVETRDGSAQTTFQYVWGTQYVDELVLIDVNGDPTDGNDANPDTEAQGESGESPADARYFAHQDRNWNVVALSAYGEGVNGAVVERYSFTPYGQFVVLRGDAAGVELGSVRPSSAVGNVFGHQGLAFDAEKGSYQNRWREYCQGLERFQMRDPLRLGPNSYVSVLSNPVYYTDPSGALPVEVGEPVQFTICDWLSNQAPSPIAYVELAGAGWNNHTSCTTSRYPDPHCDDDCIGYSVTCTASGTPTGKIITHFADVQSVESCEAVPGASAEYLASLAAVTENCFNAHEQHHIDIFQQTYVPLVATANFKGCDRQATRHDAETAAQALLGFREAEREAWGLLQHNLLDAQEGEDAVNCVLEWIRQNPPQ